MPKVSPAALRLRYMEKISPALKGHPPSQLNFSERLYEGKNCHLCPSQQWTMLTMIELLQLVEPKC